MARWTCGDCANTWPESVPTCIVCLTEDRDGAVSALARMSREHDAVVAALRVELQAARDETQRQLDVWRDSSLARYDRAIRAEAALQAAQEALRQEQDAFLALVQGVGAMLAGTRCYKRPKLKTEPDPGPCGRCAACLAVNAYAAAKGQCSGRAGRACRRPQGHTGRGRCDMTYSFLMKRDRKGLHRTCYRRRVSTTVQLRSSASARTRP